MITSRDARLVNYWWGEIERWITELKAARRHQAAYDLCGELLDVVGDRGVTQFVDSLRKDRGDLADKLDKEDPDEAAGYRAVPVDIGEKPKRVRALLAGFITGDRLVLVWEKEVADSNLKCNGGEGGGPQRGSCKRAVSLGDC